MMTAETGKYFMVAGIMLLVIGVLVYFFHDKLHWLGRLPGDIRVERESFRFYFPITTMIIVSVVLSVVVQLVRKFL